MTVNKSAMGEAIASVTDSCAKTVLCECESLCTSVVVRTGDFNRLDA